MRNQDGPKTYSRTDGVLTSAEVLLFLPAWGAALGLAIALLEKTVLYYSASDIDPEIYSLFFVVLAGGGLALGILAAMLSWLALRLGGRPRIVLSIAGCTLVGISFQVLVSFHPEFLGGETIPFIGRTLLLKGLAGVAVAVLSTLFVIRSKGVFPALFLAGSAFLTGLSAARFFPHESVLNAFSIPLIAFFGLALAAHATGRRLYLYSAVSFAVLLPAGFFLYSQRCGSAPEPALVQCDNPRPGAADLAGQRPNVIVVVLDTLRPDHVSCMGYPRPVTPHIDHFAETATLYRRAKSVSSWTLASHGSLFTGLWPRSHGARFAEEELLKDSGNNVRGVAYPLRDDVATLAEVMGRQGYSTAGIVSNYVWLCPYFRLNRGFQYYFCAPRYKQALIGKHEKTPVSPLLDGLLQVVDRRCDGNYNELKPYYRAPEITHKALSWLEKHRGKAFFLFLNYWDPHIPYNPPAPYDEMFPGRRSPRGWKLDWVKGSMPVMRGEKDIDPLRRESLVSQYDGEIAYMDHWVGRFFEGVKTLGLFDNSLIVVLSDHGESFGEHHYLEHCACLYEDEAAMFLTVKHPDQSQGAVVDSLVQTHDIMPTILRDLHILSTGEMEGQPLDEITHPIVSELYPPLGRVEVYGDRFNRRLVALYSADMKLIRSTKGTVELYNLADDPGELKNLSRNNAATRKIIKALDAWEKKHPPVVVFDVPVPDEALMHKMRSIGYLH
ncbi:MAG: sulfatase-like hydrolase/transferase [Planctomycetes bacterium]|nr:sulfatase-like hydrolase/transferase [Planctomycetota bacterium]